MFKWLLPKPTKLLAGELFENEILLQHARVNLETVRHLARLADLRIREQESMVQMLEERVERQQNELLVLHYQDNSAKEVDRVVKRRVVPLKEVNHVEPSTS